MFILLKWGVIMSKEEQVIKTINSFLNAIETFGTIDYKCIPNLYEPIRCLLDLYKQEKEKNKELEKALIDMVNQFAYDIKRKNYENDKLYTGGLSALENAFCVLDIDECIRRKDLWKKIK